MHSVFCSRLCCLCSVDFQYADAYVLYAYCFRFFYFYCAGLGFAKYFRGHQSSFLDLTSYSRTSMMYVCVRACGAVHAVRARVLSPPPTHTHTHAASSGGIYRFALYIIFLMCNITCACSIHFPFFFGPF